MIDPVIALFSFLTLTILLILFFRPQRGYFFLIKKGLIHNDKTTIEDILKQLYHAEYQGHNAHLNELVGVLNIDYKDLISAIEIMASKGLIKSSENTIQLNQAGRDYALKVIRVHRLWEKYLSEETGFDKSEWHDKAEEMEHKLSVEQANKLANKLGNPRFDPHGDPIPTDKGEMISMESQPLSQFPKDTVGKIVHIEDEPDVIYKQIIAENIDLGSRIRIIESNDHRIKFFTEGEEHILAPIVASNIGVVALQTHESTDENIERLSSLKIGEKAKIKGISRECRGANRRRLLDLGFVPETLVSVDLLSPMKDPKGYLIRDTVIALRNDQANLVLIKKETLN